MVVSVGTTVDIWSFSYLDSRRLVFPHLRVKADVDLSVSPYGSLENGERFTPRLIIED